MVKFIKSVKIKEKLKKHIGKNQSQLRLFTPIQQKYYYVALERR